MATRMLNLTINCEGCGFANRLEQRVLVPSHGTRNVICHNCEMPLTARYAFSLDGRRA